MREIEFASVLGHDLATVLKLSHALEITLSDDKRYSAQRCYEMGFVNMIVPSEKLTAEAISWAERMLYLGPRCARNLKEIICRKFYMAPLEGMALARTLEQDLFGMEDTIEGPRAFKEATKPILKGR